MAEQKLFLSVQDTWNHVPGVLARLDPSCDKRTTQLEQVECRQKQGTGPYGVYDVGNCRLSGSEAFDAVIREAQWNRNIRTVLATTQIPAQALYSKCISVRYPTSHAVVAKAINASGDIASWGQPNLALIQRIMWATANSPDAVTRLELLQALGTAPIPLSWVPTVMDGLGRAKEVVAQSGFQPAAQKALWKTIADVEGRIQNVVADQARKAAEANIQVAAGQIPVVDLPALPGFGPVIPARPATNYTPYAIFGAIAVVTLGLVLGVRARRAA